MLDSKGSNNPQDCLVCKNRNMKEIYSGLLRKCPDCGFVTANLELHDSEIEGLYNEGYFKGEEYLNYEKDKVIFRKNFSKKVTLMLKIAARENIRSILEIGCAYGFFGEIVQKMIPEATYFGVDIAKEATQYAAERLKLNVARTDYLEHNVVEKYTDVCMWDVIEHLQFPDQVIEKIHSDLLPGGRVWITTGNIDALVPRIMKSKWRMIHPPTHLHYFSARTLSLLLERIGFKVNKISHQSVLRGCKQIFYSIFMLGREHGKLIQKVYSAIPSTMSLPLNTYDIMFLQAVRK